MNGTDSWAPTVSVIICTRDRADDLARCLPSVLAADYPDFEVIVVDQSKSDASKRVAGAIADPRLRYHRQHLTGKSRALNAALALAKGEVTAHTDDDCTVPTDWLRQAVAVLEREPDAGIVFGAVAAAPHDGKDTFLPSFRPAGFRRLKGLSGRVQCQALAGANMVVRRAVFERLGGFDECLGPGSRFRSGDDLDLAYRALRAGYAVLQSSAHPPVVHWGVRRYDDGSARRLIWNNYYGKGARMMKGLRCGDPVAALALPYLAARESGAIAINLLRRRRPTGFGRLAPLLVGAARSVRQPVDRRHGVFSECTPRPG